MISTFVRYQKNDNSVRVITDCSFPAGQSLNDANKPDIRLEYPYVMAQPADIARAVLDWGAGTDLRIVKIDMSNAFKNLPVKATAWRKQTLEFCNCFFVDGRLLFGSDLSAHSWAHCSAHHSSHTSTHGISDEESNTCSCCRANSSPDPRSH